MVSNKLSGKRLILPRPKVCISKTPGGVGTPPGNWHPQEPGVDGRASFEVTPEQQTKLPPATGLINVQFFCQDCPLNAPVYVNFFWEKGANATLFTELAPTKNYPGKTGQYRLTNTGNRGIDTWLVNGLCLTPIRRGSDWFNINWDVAPPPPPPPLFCTVEPTAAVVAYPTPVEIDFQYWTETKPVGAAIPTNWQQTGGNFCLGSALLPTTNGTGFTGRRKWTPTGKGLCTFTTIGLTVLPATTCQKSYTIRWV